MIDSMTSQDTIVAISTPAGRGGLASCVSRETALSKSPRQSPWVYLLIVFLLHAGAIILIHLASQVPLTLAHEFALERYTLVMLPPLWLLLAKCVDEWWSVWNAAPEVASPAKRQTT